MNKIEKLIEQLCPEGVPYSLLEDSGSIYSGLSGKSKQDFSLGNAPYVSYLNIGNHPALPENLDSRVQVRDGEKQNFIKKGDLLFTGSSEDRQGVGLTSEVQHTPKVQTYLNSFCFGWRPIEGKFYPGFLKHLFRSEQLRAKIKSYSNGVTRINISKKLLLKTEIPIPPLEVQEKVVSILDAFTQLEAELEAELEARKIQNAQFSESLFVFKTGETKLFRIRDICGISRGTVISKDYLRDHPGEYPVYSSQTLNNGIFGYIGTFAYNFESLTWTTDGANAGSIFYHKNENFTITNVCGLLQVLNPSLISTRYLYYLLKTEAPKHVSPGMGNPKIMAGTMGDIQLEIPSFDRQLEIVEILDTFDSLLNNFSTGLPAEITARRQQYEYYRNKLLTFKELKAS